VAGYYRADFIGRNPLNSEVIAAREWDLRRLGAPEVGIVECVAVGFFSLKLHATGDARWDARLAHNLRK